MLDFAKKPGTRDCYFTPTVICKSGLGIIGKSCKNYFPIDIIWKVLRHNKSSSLCLALRKDIGKTWLATKLKSFGNFLQEITCFKVKWPLLRPPFSKSIYLTSSRFEPGWIQFRIDSDFCPSEHDINNHHFKKVWTLWSNFFLEQKGGGALVILQWKFLQLLLP